MRISSLALLMLFLLTSAASAQTPATVPPTDLDGDGRPERIGMVGVPSPEDPEQYSAARITIGRARTLEIDVAEAMPGEAYDLAIRVIDVDTNDRQREILLSVVGLSDHTMNWIFSYAKGTLRLIGKESGRVETLGDGRLAVEDWMGFWMLRQEFRIDGDASQRRLISRDDWPVGVEGRATGAFPLFRDSDPDSRPIVEWIRAGDSLTIVAWAPGDNAHPGCTDPDFGYDMFCDWYLIEAPSGLRGWARLKSFRDLVALPWAG